MAHRHHVIAPGLEPTGRGHVRQPDPGRVRQRHPVPRAILSEGLDIELTGRRAS